MRAAEESAQALKVFKQALDKEFAESPDAAGVNASAFLEFVKLRRAGGLSKRLEKARGLRALAQRFGEAGLDQGDLFADGLTEKSRHALALNDAAEAGYAAGLDNWSPDSCPHEPGSELDDTWRRSLSSARGFMQRTGQTTADETPAEVRPRRSALRDAA